MVGVHLWLAVLALAGAAPQERVMPEGWRPPTSREMERSRSRHAAEMGLARSNQQFSVAGDFDADGLPDEAMILVNDREMKFAVFLDRGAGGPIVRLSDRMPLDLIWNHGLAVTAPGVYPTACGRGVGEEEGCQKEVTLRAPGVSLMTYQAGVETFYWTAGGFKLTTLSD
jgi:hypothetical protein